MKKLLFGIVVCLCLSACGAAQTFETVADEWVEPALAEPGEICLSLPETAVSAAGGNYWYWDTGEISLERYRSGDLAGTIRQISGYGQDAVTCLTREQGGYCRYDLVWAAAGETGEQVCRAAILNDGQYHYVLTAVTDADRQEELSVALDAMFASFSLEAY